MNKGWLLWGDADANDMKVTKRVNVKRENGVISSP